MRVFATQLPQLFLAYRLSFTTTAAGADVIENAHIAADRVPIQGMVDGAVAHASVVHVANNGLERFEVFAGVAIKLHIGDMPGIGHGMIRRFDVDLAKSPDGEIDGNMEGVGIILPVRHAGNGAVAGAIQLDEAPGKPLRGRGDEREIKPRQTGFLIGAPTHMPDNLQPQFLRFLAFAVMLARHKKYILFNLPASKLEEAAAVIGGMKSPTVTPLMDEGWVSVQSAVDEDRFWAVFEELRKLGAEGILVMNIEKMTE